MSQIIQIAKEKSPDSFSVSEYVKSTPFSNNHITAYDVVGLSWVFLDDPVSYLAHSERRCNVNE